MVRFYNLDFEMRIEIEIFKNINQLTCHQHFLMVMS